MKCSALRSLGWRIGRALYRAARHEGVNSPDSNGEYWLLDRVVSMTSNVSLVLLDIGANKGDWTQKASAHLRTGNIVGRVFAFEPTQATFEYLSTRFSNDDLVHARRCALSHTVGEGEIFVGMEFAGTNSLHWTEGAGTERVALTTVDRFLEEERIANVLFAKSDTEGHDFRVLIGAEQTLRSGRVEVWQFEYNHRWLSEKTSLRDVFLFVADMPYIVGKLYGNGIEAYAHWHPELDKFNETNYVLIRKGSVYEGLCNWAQFDASNVAVPLKNRHAKLPGVHIRGSVKDE